MSLTAPPLLPATTEAATPERTRSWSGRDRLLRSRGAIAALVLVIVAAVVAVALGGRGSTHGLMDPDSYDPTGAHALAALLRDRGVVVERVDTVQQAVAHASSRTTVVVADPDAEPDLGPLARVASLVLVEPGPEALSQLQPGVRIGGSVNRQTLSPGCSEPDAVLAGPIDGGGDSYLDQGSGGFSCYSGTLYDARTAAGTIVDVGSSDTWSNRYLGDQGNAALGLGLLGHGDAVVWLVPGPVPLAATGTTPLDQLLPARLGWATDQLLIALALLMLWRARRFGRLVREPLPVSVRASETVEGLGRLYRVSRSRRRAADALRTAARSRLTPRLGLRRDDPATAVVEAVALRTGRPATDVAALLNGAEPGDDPALVVLADQLDALEAEVRRS